MKNENKMKGLTLIIFFYSLFEVYVTVTPNSPFLHLSAFDILQQFINLGVTLVLIDFVIKDDSNFSKKLFFFSQASIFLIQSLIFRWDVVAINKDAIGFKLMLFYTSTIFIVDFLLRAWLIYLSYNEREVKKN